MVIQRIFGVFTPLFCRAAAPGKRLPVAHIRHALLHTLHDCSDMGAQRLIYKINAAHTPFDLWLLRSDLHQCISQTHSQSEAAKRINALIPAFDGWFPARQLTRI